MENTSAIQRHMYNLQPLTLFPILLMPSRFYRFKASLYFSFNPKLKIFCKTTFMEFCHFTCSVEKTQVEFQTITKSRFS